MSTTQLRGNVPFTEEFTETNWSRYTVANGATDVGQMGDQSTASFNWGLSTLEHIDLRSFEILPLSNLAQQQENWALISGAGTFTVGPDPTYNYWPRATLTLSTGAVTFRSVSDAVDITRVGTDDTVQLTLALPSFPLGSIDITQTYLDLSSDGFATTLCPLLFANSTTTLVNGNSTASWLMTDLSGSGVDPTQINGVRLRITATASCVFYATALRVITAGWVQPSVDFDTWNGALRTSIPLNGNSAAIVPGNQVVPRVWYTSTAGASNDPQPIDGTFGVIFNTGDQTFINSFALNLRAVGGVDSSQLSLQGLTQAQLSGPQPNLSPSTEEPRTMAEMQLLTMATASGQTMQALEEEAEAFSETWLSFNLTWGLYEQLQITNSLNIKPYIWTTTQLPTLAQYTWYLAVFALTDTTARAQICSVDQSYLSTKYFNNQPVIIFDTGQIKDSYQFPRRAGRVGWQASLGGAAQVRSIRPTSLNFAQYRSIALNSNTPVKGARLYCQYSPSNELFQSFTASEPYAVSASGAPIPFVAPPTPLGAPGLVSPPQITGGGTQPGYVLAATEGAWSNNPTSFTYQWEYSDGTIISGATTNTYTIRYGDTGQMIQVVVTAINASGSSHATSLTIGPVVSAPVNLTVPVVSGTAQAGDILSTTNGTWSGSPTSFTYLWTSEAPGSAPVNTGVPTISAPDGGVLGMSMLLGSGATGSTYTVQSTDVGNVIYVTVTATNSQGSGTANSALTSMVTAAPGPINTALPTISGTTQQGSTLYATTGSWNGSPTSYAYQWQRSGSNLSGATGTSYVLQAGDVGYTIDVMVTATNASGSASATSTATATITAPPYVALNASTPANSFFDGIAGPYTTNVFSPPAGSVIVLASIYLTGNGTNTTTSSISDSKSHTWTHLANANSDTSSYPFELDVWYASVPTAPGTMSVTVNYSPTNDGYGAANIIPLVFTGAAATQSGNAIAATSGGYGGFGGFGGFYVPPNVTLTTTQSGSQIVTLSYTDSGAPITPASGTTMTIGGSSTYDIEYGDYISILTTAAGAAGSNVTVGDSNPSDLCQGLLAMEIIN